MNCKDGLNEHQEMEARKLRQKLLDYKQRGEVLKEVSDIWNEFRMLDFDTYFKSKNPVLYSACKRSDVHIEVRKPKPMLIIK